MVCLLLCCFLDYCLFVLVWDGLLILDLIVLLFVRYNISCCLFYFYLYLLDCDHLRFVCLVGYFVCIGYFVVWLFVFVYYACCLFCWCNLVCLWFDLCCCLLCVIFGLFLLGFYSLSCVLLFYYLLCWCFVTVLFWCVIDGCVFILCCLLLWVLLAWLLALCFVAGILRLPNFLFWVVVLVWFGLLFGCLLSSVVVCGLVSGWFGWHILLACFLDVL